MTESENRLLKADIDAWNLIDWFARSGSDRFDLEQIEQRLAFVTGENARPTIYALAGHASTAFAMVAKERGIAVEDVLAEYSATNALAHLDGELDGEEDA